jgi:hypothetical protein
MIVKSEFGLNFEHDKVIKLIKKAFIPANK